MNGKIAVVTQEDGERISSHFGMAPYFRVFQVEDGAVVRDELRPKPHHARHPHHHEDHAHHGKGRGHLGAQMVAAIDDCQVLICGGMGTPAYQRAQAAGLEVVLAGGKAVDAVTAYLNGELESDLRRVHR
ncbi:MAG: dinitrogenase iron-molybdenum cofactor biosynthesis protein [Anaerolineae bacterium]|nr:MAG: dinitrogenase iron-molybdenum cofactor biosynthesis protein [Anaerolineae bacterium]